MDKNKVESLIRELLLEIEGNSTLREETLKTPKRVANAYSEIFNGYEQDLEEDITLFKASYSEIIISKDIKFYSMCEHHILPYFGKVDIAYIPNDYILGISKFARIVNFFSHRLNVQERMTDNIANYIMNGNLKPKGVMVIVKGTHLCEIMRGVKEPNPVMITSAIKGIFKENIATRNEALQLLKI